VCVLFFENVQYHQNIENELNIKDQNKKFLLVSVLTVLFRLCYNKVRLIKQVRVVLIGGVEVIRFCTFFAFRYYYYSILHNQNQAKVP
ncbi:hypothetical protein, partial [Streptococcus iniae]